MTTMTLKIKEKTKAGKAFMTMTDSLIASKIVEVVIRKKQTRVIFEKPTLLQQIEMGLKEVKILKNNNVKRKSLTELLNEK